MKKLHLFKRTLLLLALIVGCVNYGWAETVTYTFSSSSWAASDGSSAANWTGSATADGFDGTKGVQIYKASNGINATSPVSFDNISKIVVTWSTSSKGVGSVQIKIGSGEYETIGTVSTSQTNQTFTKNYATPLSGSVNLKVTCTTSSIYIKSVAITYAPAPSYTITPAVNNALYGSVSLSGTTITADPEDGYRVMNGSDGYSVTSGSATVAHEGYSNTLTVTPSSNCTVQVNFEAIPTFESITLTGTYPIVFTEGDAFSHEGMTVTANYSDSSTKDVTEDATFSGYNMSTVGAQTVTVSYTEDKITRTTNYGITVNAIPTHIATFSVNGGTSTNDFKEGASVVFPANPGDVGGKTFVGWVTDAIPGSTDVEPSFVNTATATMGDADITYYAVFATVESGSTIKQDILTSSVTGIKASSYSNFSNKTVSGGSSAVYAGNCAGSNTYIQLRTSSNTGIISTTSGGKVKKVTLAWSSTSDRALKVYGSNSAYESLSDIFDEEKRGALLGTIVYNSTELNIAGDYEYIGIIPDSEKSGASQLSSITIDWEISSITHSAYCTTVSDKPIPTITFTKDEETITELNATATEMEEVSVSCTAGDVTITVESDDETVAEYVEGYVLAYKSGTATLTATFAGNGEYQGTTATLTVNVAKKATTTTVGVEIDDTDIYTATEGGLAAATVKAGDAIVTPAAVTWTSSATNVATIASDGSITLVGVGTTTITASYAGTDVYGASQGTYELTLTSSKPQETNINITPNYEFYGKNATFSGSTYDVLTGQQDNVSVTYTRNTGSTYANKNAMRFYKDNNLEISAPSGYHIIGITLTLEDLSSDITTNVDTYTAGTGVWSGDASAVTFSRPSNASSYATISKIAVTLAPTVTISASGWTSLASAYDLDFSSAEEQESVPVVAYAISSIKKTSVTLTPHDAAPAGVGMILKGNPGSTYSIPVTTSVESFDNELSAAVNATAVAANSVYAVSGGKLKLFTGTEVPAGKAYLEATKVPAGAHGLTLDFDEDGETTGIAEISSKKGLLDGDFYDLSGRKVVQPTKGLYIMNGKKVIIK